jgi:hypothetical protein
MLGQTADISFICSLLGMIGFTTTSRMRHFPASKTTLGRYLGPADPEAGSVLSAKILPFEGNDIRRNTFRHFTHLEAKKR